MKYDIVCAPSYSLLEMTLNEGESVIVEPGSMAWMDTTVKPKTEMKGGLFAGLKRRMGGESFFLNTYTAEGGSGKIGIAPGYSGDIVVKELNDETIYMERGAYLCHLGNIETSATWEGFKGIFAEGMLGLRVSGTGLLFFGSYGDIQEVEVNGSYVVDNGYAVAWESSLDYSISFSGRKIRHFLFSEQFLCQYHGNGKLWIQTRSPRNLAAWVHPFRPVQSKDRN
jgi:uncharacterized protein (TIGR00266 family)